MNEAGLRKYVKEVLLKNDALNADIIPKEIKQELEKEAGKLQSILVSLMKDCTDLNKINEAIKLLSSWKTRIEKVLD